MVSPVEGVKVPPRSRSRSRSRSVEGMSIGSSPFSLSSSTSSSSSSASFRFLSPVQSSKCSRYAKKGIMGLFLAALVGGISVAVPLLASVAVSFLPVIIAVAVGGVLIATPVAALALACAFLMLVKSRLDGKSQSRLRKAAVRLIDVWIVFLLPFHAIAVLVIVATFSIGWGLAIGAVLVGFPRFSSYFSAGQIHRRKGIIKWFGKIFMPPIFSYFPVKVHAEKDATTMDDEQHRRPRLYCYHPHGMYAFGLFTLLFPEQSGIEAARPILVGVASSLLSIPVFGQICAMFGFIPASRRFIERLLKKLQREKEEIDYDLALVPGGIAEMLEHSDGHEDCKDVVETVFLRTRKGFVRLALKYGFDLVPVYGFGENATFKRYSFARKFRETISRYCRVVLQPFRGRYFTLIPFNVPINVVIGSPIRLPPMITSSQPLPEEIDAAHKRYMLELHRLFEKHKTRFPRYAKATLKFV